MEVQKFPPKLIKALSTEVKDTKGVISQAYQTMVQRREGSRDYYMPANALLASVQQTRESFRAQADACVSLITDETRQLREIAAKNAYSIAALRRTSENLRRAPQPGDENPISLAIRSLSAMAPFVIFALMCFCSE